MTRRIIFIPFIALILITCSLPAQAFNRESHKENREESLNSLQKRFDWWPTDAKPGAVKDKVKGGYWWYPTSPGKVKPWGNRGYIYVYKIIFDYKEDRLPPPKADELRPSLLIRKIHKNYKAYFDFDKSDLRQDAVLMLQEGLQRLKKNPDTSILITGNADMRGSESYNERLAGDRGEAVRRFMIDNGIPEERIRVVSRGKLDAVAPLSDLIGMQKDRNAQFIVADVDEVLLPYPGVQPDENIRKVDDEKYMVEENEEVASDILVMTREIIVEDGDTLSGIAKREMGSAHRWIHLYELNKDRIENPDYLTPGQTLIIPIE
jgi:outer membrane protein OmpA-like peptidoglycan-associated protein